MIKTIAKFKTQVKVELIQKKWDFQSTKNYSKSNIYNQISKYISNRYNVNVS